MIFNMQLSEDASLAELSDIRVGVDGTVYPSAGDAVRGQITDVKEDLNGYIIETSKTGSRATAGTTYEKYRFISGIKYVLLNTSDSSALVAKTKNKSNTSDVQTITSGLGAGKSKVFTASADAYYIEVYFDGTGTFTVKSLTSVDQRIEAINEDTVGIHRDISHDYKLNGTSAGYYYVEFDFDPNNVYSFKNNYSGSVAIDTCDSPTDSAQRIDNVTGGITGVSYTFLYPTQKAKYLRVYFTGSNGKLEIHTQKAINARLDDDERLIKQVINNKSFAFSGATSYFPFSFVQGKKYRVTNTGEDATSVVLRNPGVGTVQTISGGLYAGNSVDFTAEQDALVIAFLGVQTGNYEFHLEEIFDNTKNGYRTGQINFTVPVNQKRLINTLGTASTTQDDENNIVNIDCVCMLPTSYKPTGKPSKLLMICHGSGGGVSEGVWFNNDITAFLQQFLNDGFVIFDCNGYKNGYAGQEHWGVEKAVWAYHKAYEYMIANYNVEHDMSIYAFSMGGLAGLNYVNAFPLNVKALALASPVTSIYESVWVDESVAVKEAVATAYGFNDAVTYEASKVGNCDPQTRIKTIDGTNYYMGKVPPTKIWHGDSDTAVYYTHSQALCEALNNSGNFAYYRLVSGKGHEICYGGSAAVTSEILYFLNRFN